MSQCSVLFQSFALRLLCISHSAGQLSVNHQMNKILRISKVTASILAVALILYALFSSINVFRYITPSSNIDDYETTIVQYRGVYTSHFPKTIPPTAKNVSFFHEPSVMQGAARLQLRVVLTSKEISKIRNDLEGKFISRTFGNRASDDSENMMPRRVSSDKFADKRVANYEIFTISKTPDDEWNHPKFSGIAISDEFSEVLYWYEDW